ncbi:MAG: 4-hydroxythreonine-4-phosphate dehydrogenase PdxA [Thermodesulfobacteriota bacterium]|nr:4-hydroxythreonine-4-phosphate dehydrogenase PdxA [Thermodesulfobacteriota bacterium]
MTAKTLILTLGDPNGLGPELVCKLFSASTKISGRIVLIGPEAALSYHQKRLSTPRFWKKITRPEVPSPPQGISLYCPEELTSEVTPGQARPEGGLAAGASLEAACEFLNQGWAKGLVTCPLNKAMLMEAGFDFPGHTEFLAHKLGVGQENVCMHLCGSKLRVSLVTTHPPLSRVPELITRERILRCLELTAGLMRDLGVYDRPIAVCGLNPHAGEQGKIGTEEVDVIAPAVAEAVKMGIDARGPLPGDTVFYQAAHGKYSAVLAMYHDQGLAPLKLLHFNKAVNVTLGLPVVRTSVDHGTGYDLVGRDKASLGSLRAALRLARKLVRAGD